MGKKGTYLNLYRGLNLYRATSLQYLPLLYLSCMGSLTETKCKRSRKILCGKVQLMLKERQKLPNSQVDTKLPLPDRVIYYIHFNRKYIQESDAAILKLLYFPE